MVFTQGRGFVLGASFGLQTPLAPLSRSGLPRRGHRLSKSVADMLHSANWASLFALVYARVRMRKLAIRICPVFPIHLEVRELEKLYGDSFSGR